MIVYKPGPEMYLADTLSRAFLPTTENTQGEFERVNAVKLLPMTDERLEEMRNSTRDDAVFFFYFFYFITLYLLALRLTY